jgi:mannose-6-phosphate isomerase-like protein (cupin superfamily)
MKRKQLRFGLGFKVVVGNRRSQAAQMVMSPGDSGGDPNSRHRNADQWRYVVEGRGKTTVNGRTYTLKAGTLLLIEHRDRHEIRAIGRRPLKTLNIYIPPGYKPAGNALAAARRSGP